jgi:hypothetical protein
VPNVGGAPAGDVVAGVACEPVGAGVLHAAAPTSKPSGALIKNWRRVFISTSSS